MYANISVDADCCAEFIANLTESDGQDPPSWGPKRYPNPFIGQSIPQRISSNADTAVREGLRRWMQICDRADANSTMRMTLDSGPQSSWP